MEQPLAGQHKITALYLCKIAMSVMESLHYILIRFTTMGLKYFVTSVITNWFHHPCRGNAV